MPHPVIVFRTNANETVGLGHLRRCMTLAEALQKEGADIHFIVNREGFPDAWLRKYGWNSVGVEENDAGTLEQTLAHARLWDAQILVIDSYAIRGECLGAVRKPQVAVIDDLADRPLPVALVVNGSVNARALKYQTSTGTRVLLGPDYILLRNEFADEPARTFATEIRRVLIMLGGADRDGLSAKMVAWTREALGSTVSLEVIVGPLFSERVVSDLERMTEQDTALEIGQDPHTIRDAMLKCDVALTAGGQTTYELAATGTPTVAIRMADNQTGNLTGLSDTGFLSWAGDVSDQDLAAKVTSSLSGLSDKARREAMSRAGRALVDGKGAKRVAQAVLEMFSQ